MDYEAKEDRRVRKTKKALREGLAELLADKSIQYITVRELTDKADVHRSTFYANFKDIYDLYNHIEETVVDELNNILLSVQNLESAQIVILLLQFISDNKQVSRLVLGNNASSAFLHRISALFKGLCNTHWQQIHNLSIPTHKLGVYTHFLYSGYLGVISEWVASDFALPENELVELLSDIDINFEEFIESKLA